MRLFDKLFLSEVNFDLRISLLFSLLLIYTNLKSLLQNPSELDNWLADLNPNSKTVIREAFCVPILKDAKLGDRFQFERLGKEFTKWLFLLAYMITNCFL